MIDAEIFMSSLRKEMGDRGLHERSSNFFETISNLGHSTLFRELCLGLFKGDDVPKENGLSEREREKMVDTCNSGRTPSGGERVRDLKVIKDFFSPIPPPPHVSSFRLSSPTPCFFLRYSLSLPSLEGRVGNLSILLQLPVDTLFFSVDGGGYLLSPSQKFDRGS